MVQEFSKSDFVNMFVYIVMMCTIIHVLLIYVYLCVCIIPVCFCALISLHEQYTVTRVQLHERYVYCNLELSFHNFDITIKDGHV